MKTNKEYKSIAFARISGNWAPLLVATIIFFLSTLVCVCVMEWTTISTSIPWLAPMAPTSIGGTLIFLIIGLLLFIFIIGPLTVGFYNAIKLFIECGNNSLTSNMFQFALDDYMKSVVAVLLVSIKTALWACLLIVPGIIKSFSYSLTPFIIHDRPELSASQAIHESERLMKGHKLELFYLILSFIGWLILGTISLGIAYFWILPYFQSSFALFYTDILAIEDGSPVDGNFDID